jgi:hypothetical protein
MRPMEFWKTDRFEAGESLNAFVLTRDSQENAAEFCTLNWQESQNICKMTK